MLLLPGAILGEDGVFSLAAEAGSLWVEDEGSALSWRSGLSFQKDERLYAALALGQVVSTLPWAEGAVLGGLGNFGFGLPRFGLDFSGGFFYHPLFSSETDSFSVYNDEGRGGFSAVTMPVRVGEWSVAPSFLYGSGAWAEGSLYWFFGRPTIPALAVYGLSLRYQKQHELAFHALSLDMDILDDDAERLFDSHAEAYIASYRFFLEIANLRLGGSLGACFATAEINGALTASNQHFVYFPYNFYALDGSLGASAGFGAVDLRQTFSVFQYRIMIGAVHVFQGEGLADIHYKEKTLFGGQEAFDALSLDIGGVGAAVMLLDAGFPALRLGRGERARLSLGMKKLFVVPWGHEAVLPGGSASPGEGGGDISVNKLPQIALLSGLSFYGSFSW
ncbi:MAG: hypothetical protein LBU16_00460 [Treponema sp.]|nr:hypothetical protein [Treponema sp.]